MIFAPFGALVSSVRMLTSAVHDARMLAEAKPNRDRRRSERRMGDELSDVGAATLSAVAPRRTAKNECGLHLTVDWVIHATFREKLATRVASSRQEARVGWRRSQPFT